MPALPSSAEKLLITDLLSRYQLEGTHGRPVTDLADNLTVYFGMSLIQILDVDESNQVLKCSVWYHYAWKDILLQWDPLEHDGVESIRVPSDKIWLPDIQLYNFADDRLHEQREALVIVNHEGQILWMPQAILRSSCAFNTKYFPFDLQTCHVKFGSWTYNGNKLNIDFVSNQSFDLSDFVFSNEWDIVENYARRTVKYYTCCKDAPFPDLTFTLTIKRKVAFYTFILLIPCALLSLLTLVIFWVPPESPAKLQLGMSVFVAFFFLLMVLADFTPRTAASIPLIGAYFCLSMIMITMSTVLACVAANMFFRGIRINKAPPWLRTLMIDWLSRVFCVHEKVQIPRYEQTGGATISWTTSNEQNGKLPEPEVKFVKLRLLDHETDSRMFAKQESFESCSWDSFSEKSSFLFKNNALLEEVRGIREVIQRHEAKKLAAGEKEKVVLEWRIISCVTDRLCFAVYIVINIVGLLVILFCM
ncbi:hypothetical protein C0Q70_00942 [Pomacea canaliculata]|uniref:Neurotransmitter-gated ion-channel ligand-binding domain-containing protein n=2 Tax=Pomacea canaliculata TaxID=400727 RepID=A0A2T7PY52_POMCA|nr:hypothetical protein C0Q70_00942 [Pomacea canaliculata]